MCKIKKFSVDQCLSNNSFKLRYYNRLQFLAQMFDLVTRKNNVGNHFSLKQISGLCHQRVLCKNIYEKKKRALTKRRFIKLMWPALCSSF
jgi:hypothetical protein